MKFIADENEVNILIAPANGLPGVKAELDFNHTRVIDHDEDYQTMSWEIHLKDHHQLRFQAYQFIVAGLERRTVALNGLQYLIEHPEENERILKIVHGTVKFECDLAWGKCYGDPVLFFDNSEMRSLHEKQHRGLLAMFKSVVNSVFRIENPAPEVHDLSLVLFGNDITLELIEAHLLRANSVDKQDC